MKIAMTDMDIIWEDKVANKEQCLLMIAEAAEKKAELILFPEMTLIGFSMTVEKICDKADETIRFFSEQARRYHLAIGFGYVTVNVDGKGQNHFCIVDVEGKQIMDYIKIHPFTYGGEATCYEGGNRIVSFSIGDFTCGAFICYDLRFPEAFQQLPVDTDAIFIIANWPEVRLSHWYTLLQARAIEMQCYVVGVNRTGEGGGLIYSKSSAAFDADGCRLPEESGERNRYVIIDQTKRRAFAEKFPVRPDRRMEVYLNSLSSE